MLLVKFLIMSIISNLVVLVILYYLYNKYGIISCCGKPPRVKWRNIIIISVIGSLLMYIAYGKFLQ